jgi:hypothetical protein
MIPLYIPWYISQLIYHSVFRRLYVCPKVGTNLSPAQAVLNLSGQPLFNTWKNLASWIESIPSKSSAMVLCAMEKFARYSSVKFLGNGQVSAREYQVLLYRIPNKDLPPDSEGVLRLEQIYETGGYEEPQLRGKSEISNMSTEEFVLKHGGPEALEWMFHPFLATMVLARPKDISIAHPISLFALMKGMRSMEGGLGSITAGLYEKVKDCVRLTTPVT